MKIKEMIEMLGKFDPEADIVAFNSTSNRWFKTGDKENYTPKTVEQIYESLGNFAKKQMDNFNKTDVAIYI